MTKIQIDLPEATVQAATKEGLLAPQALSALLNDELTRRKAIDPKGTVAHRVADAGVLWMTQAEEFPVTKIQIELSEATAEAARAAGLLTPQALDRLLIDALRRHQAIDSLLSIADRVAAAGIPPMTDEEIDAEVKAARAERKKRAGDS